MTKRSSFAASRQEKSRPMAWAAGKLARLCLLAPLLLAACNLPARGFSATPTVDAVGTQVSQMLTQAPTQTSTPTIAPAASETAAPSPTEAAATHPAPTPTTAAAAPPTASPTLPSGDPRSSLGEPTLLDSLESGKTFYQYENDNTKVAIQNGSLLLTGLTNNGWLGWSLTYSKPAQNFYLEGVFSPQTCSGSDLYGLVFRSANNDSGYFYGATCDGRYSLQARNFQDGTDVEIIDLTQGPALQSGSNSVNRLGVMVNGDHISLYANGTLLQETTDDTFKEKGNFGAFVAANVTPGFTVKMDEIRLWVLP